MAKDERIIKQLPQPVQEAILQLQKVAFDALVDDKIVFAIHDLPAMCRYDPTCFGLLQSVECYCADEIGGLTQSFNFLHLGVQEHFAAKYVATLHEDYVYKLSIHFLSALAMRVMLFMSLSLIIIIMLNVSAYQTCGSFIVISLVVL